VLRANDAYFLDKPQVARVVVQLMADDNSRAVALRTGETDWSFQATAIAARQFVGSTTVHTVLLNVNAYTGFKLQTRRPPLDDVRVRRALAYAIDLPTMVAKISGDFALPAVSDIGPAVWAYDPAVKPLDYDPARSRDLLDAAGWQTGANGIRERNGKSLALQLVYPAGSTVNEAYAVQTQSLLRAVGVDLSLKPQQANVLFAPAAQRGIVMGGDFDLAYVGFYNTADPNDRRSFACASIPPDGFNISRWCNAQYDRVTNDALLHTDRATRKRDYARASQLLVDDVPEIFVTWPKDIELTRAGVSIDDGFHNLAQPYHFHFAR
jgi:peptide/nickel transport system substrate-binding protein